MRHRNRWFTNAETIFEAGHDADMAGSKLAKTFVFETLSGFRFDVMFSGILIIVLLI